jgi:hypothetical protein
MNKIKIVRTLAITAMGKLRNLNSTHLIMRNFYLNNSLTTKVKFNNNNYNNIGQQKPGRLCK